MSKLKVLSFAMSIDGFSAGLSQDLQNPLGVGVATIRQFLQARLIDELRLVIMPVLGNGESLLTGIDARALGYECVSHVAGTRASAHVTLRKRS